MSIFYTPGAIVWNIKRENYNRSQITKIAGHSSYARMTTRNVNTARKLAALCAEILTPASLPHKRLQSACLRRLCIEAVTFLAERTHFDGESAAAIRLGKRAVELVAEEYGPESLELVPELNNLSLMYGRARDLEAQETTLRRSLAVMDLHHVVNDSYGIALYNLAHAVRRAGRYDEFVSLLERCLTVRRGVIREDDPYLADTLRDLGMIRIEQSQMG